MEALFLKLVNMSITAGWLVLAIAAVRLLFRRTPRWILCLLWGLVALRLICPVSIESSLSMIPSAEPLPQEILYTAHPQIQSGVPMIDSAVNPALQSSMAPAELTSANPTQIWSFLLSRVWVLGMVLMLLYTAGSYLLLKRRVAAAIPLCRGIKQSEHVDSPFVLGLIRPVIYLPFGMESPDMDHVIAHEKAHIRRRDHWWKPLGFLLLSIYWFNPLLWLAYVLLCRDIEAACDEKVIRDMDRNGRRAYSRALLNCSIHRRRIAACPLAFGEVGVKARVKGVMYYRKPAFWVILTALLGAVIVGICFLTNPETTCPVTMKLQYFDRTGAHVFFYADEALSREDYRISQDYTLETLRSGIWRKLSPMSEHAASGEVYDASDGADYLAWSTPDWEERYGSLPEGDYRIRWELTLKEKRRTIYAEFSIGGTAEPFVTYTLENITPTGAALYEQEQQSEEVQLIYGDGSGIWLEIWEKDAWHYLEPTQELPSYMNKERHFLREMIYPGSHTQLDWSRLYGALPGGTYRIAREIVVNAPQENRLCTVYGEFTISPEGSGTIVSIPGQTLSLNDVILLSRKGKDLSMEDFQFYGCYFREAREELRTYPINEEWNLVIHLEEASKPGSFLLTHISSGDNLDITQGNEQEAITGFISRHNPQATERLVCLDIWTRKHVCLPPGDQAEALRALLPDPEKGLLPASAADLAQARADDFNTVFFVFTYELGSKTLCFSEDFRFFWEQGSENGYALSEPEPLRQYVTALMDGVRKKETSGEPFATMDTPWDWCANIRENAVESAQLHVCFYTYSDGLRRETRATNGVLSYETLGALTEVLRNVPRDAFSPANSLRKNDYRGHFIDQQSENTAISIVDGVNGLGVILRCRGETVTMLLTDEIEQARELEGDYLQSLRVWTVEDPQLRSYLASISENPPIISYSVGAEYLWQPVRTIPMGEYQLQLRLIDGWEVQTVATASSTGLRCRPAEVTEGWLYFSFWPGEYTPEEENRFINQGQFYDWTFYASYPDSIATENGYSTRHAIWSWLRYDLEEGDLAVINEGADAWFPHYEDPIEDILMLMQITSS